VSRHAHRPLLEAARHVLREEDPNEQPSRIVKERIVMDLEFFEPAEAAALMRCSEGWLRDGASSGRFPHACWGKGKIVFTSEHIAEIARISEILPGSSHPAPDVREGSNTSTRLIGTRARNRMAS
jgi:hypothetical protein